MKMHEYAVNIRTIGGKRLLSRKEKAGSVRAALSQFMARFEKDAGSYASAIEVVAVVRLGWD